MWRSMERGKHGMKKAEERSAERRGGWGKVAKEKETGKEQGKKGRGLGGKAQGEKRGMRGLADRERGMRRERGTKGGAGAETRSGAGMGCVGTGGRRSEGKEAGKKVAGEKLRKVPRGCLGKGEKKGKNLASVAMKKENKPIVCKFIVFL